MQSLCFVIINQTTDARLTAPVLQQMADALEAYLNEDVAPVWGGSYKVRVDTAAGPGEVPATIVPTLQDAPGAEAYHDRQADGTPIIYAALETFDDIIAGGNALSEGLAHEFAETVGDPGANRWSDRIDGIEEALELCDRLQGTGYEKNGVMVANFLFPSAFDPGASAPYDQGGVLTTATGVTPGGYVILRQDGAQVASAMRGDGKKVIGVVVQKQARVEGALTPKQRAKKRHHTSRTWRRGVRLDP